MWTRVTRKNILVTLVHIVLQFGGELEQLFRVPLQVGLALFVGPLLHFLLYMWRQGRWLFATRNILLRDWQSLRELLLGGKPRQSAQRQRQKQKSSFPEHGGPHAK